MYIQRTWTITTPLRVTEGVSPPRAVLDTLYLNQGRDYDATNASGDGKPNGIHYHGSEHGEVVWLGFPLYYFEPDQARALVHRVMTVFGYPPVAPLHATRRAAGAGRAPDLAGDP
jgi:hypothetical protein